MTIATTGAEIAVIDARPVGALAVSTGQTFWTEPQQAALAQIGVDSAPLGDQLVLLHHSQRTGLDPFAKQLYLIGRNDRDAPGGKKWSIQTGIDGFRVIARRTADRLGESLEYEDTLWCGEDGVWRDAWLTDKPPSAAKVIVLRHGRRFSATARFGAYAQRKYGGDLTKQWAVMGDVMIAKCAEALALRKAYPHDLSGLVTDDEMAHLDNPAAPPGPAVAAPHASAILASAAPQSGSAGIDPDEIADRIAAADSVDQLRDIAAELYAAEQARALDPDDIARLREATTGRAGELPAGEKALKRMHAALGDLGLTKDRDQKLLAVANVVGHPVASTSELTGAEADAVWRAAAAAKDDGGAAALLFVDGQDDTAPADAAPFEEDIPDDVGVSPEEQAAYAAGEL